MWYSSLRLHNQAGLRRYLKLFQGEKLFIVCIHSVPNPIDGLMEHEVKWKLELIGWEQAFQNLILEGLEAKVA